MSEAMNTPSFFGRDKFGLMTEEEFAALMNVKPITLAKWRRDGKGPKYISPGKEVFYAAGHVVEWLNSVAEAPYVDAKPHGPPAALTPALCEACKGRPQQPNVSVYCKECADWFAANPPPVPQEATEGVHSLEVRHDGGTVL